MDFKIQRKGRVGKGRVGKGREGDEMTASVISGFSFSKTEKEFRMELNRQY
jgi:hypothetical protein